MKLGELAAALGLELSGDAELEIIAAVPLEAAAPGTISFVSQPRYLAMLERVSPSCVIMPAELAARVAMRGPEKSEPGALTLPAPWEFSIRRYRPPAGHRSQRANCSRRRKSGGTPASAPSS